MFSFILTLVRLVNVIRQNLKDPEFRSLLLLFIILLVIGTTFYVSVEGWSVLDALYFSVATLTTVGYGDFTPKTAFGKMFTILYLLVGVGVFVAFAAKLAVALNRQPSAPPSTDTAKPTPDDSQPNKN